jgi:hypothetical protein
MADIESLILGSGKLTRILVNSFMPAFIHRVQGLQQERSQQLLWRDRRSPLLAYSLLNRGCNSLNASSVMTRRGRKG